VPLTVTAGRSSFSATPAATIQQHAGPQRQGQGLCQGGKAATFLLFITIVVIATTRVWSSVVVAAGRTVLEERRRCRVETSPSRRVATTGRTHQTDSQGEIRLKNNGRTTNGRKATGNLPGKAKASGRTQAQDRARQGLGHYEHVSSRRVGGP